MAMAQLYSIMKRIILILLLLSICFITVSCHYYTETIDDHWDPMELSKEKVHFRGNGGEIIIYCYNYGSWDISSFKEVNPDTGEVIKNYNPGENGNTFEEINGEGIRVVVEDDNPKDNQTSVRVVVEPNPNVRNWVLKMHSMNIWSSPIYVTQN